MPWRTTCPMDERRKFVNDWLSREWNVSELSRIYGISRPTAYKWLKRFRSHGEAGMMEETRAPKTHPNATPKDVEAAVVGERQRHPYWGPRKLLYRLERISPGKDWPSSSTIGEILKRHGLATARKKRRRMAPYPEPLSVGPKPNDVWAMDFKGWFRTRDGTRIDPLTVSDVASRYIIHCRSVRETDGETVRGQLAVAFKEYGLPRAMRSDNGPPFASLAVAGLSRLSVWLIRLGIEPERIEPGHPEQNGVHERMHKTLEQATANPPKTNRRAQDVAFEWFRKEFNEERPHEALGMRVPADFYRPSEREFPRKLPEIEYPAAMKVYRVCGNGCIKPGRDVNVFISNSLIGEPVGLIRIDDTRWEVRYATILLGIYDENTAKLTAV